MPRPATGQIVEYKGRDGRIYRSLRFRVGGRRHTVPLGVVSRADAERELAHVMADVARGLWKPPTFAKAPAEVEVPTFHAFSEEWWVRKQAQLAENTQADYRWRLECHLLPHFGEMRLDAIAFDAIERYIAAELAADDPLSPRSINMTVTLLGAILERAVKRKLIDHNPAKDKDLRVKEREPVRSYLDSAEQIVALLDAAGDLDRRAPSDRRHVKRRAMLAVLVFAGLRISELCGLRWRHVDLAGGWLHTGSKTDAGYRVVKIRGALRRELTALRADCGPVKQDAYVFATARGGRMSDDNFRSRVLGRAAVVVDGEEKKAGTGAVGRANRNRERADLPPLPALTPHSLRRTFCSLLYALGEDPGVVMDEMGHTDPALALRVYRQAMRRGEGEKAALWALVEGETLPAEESTAATVPTT
jgi:integrase